MRQVAIVTGGGGGIGQAIATKLAESHDYVVLVDIDEAKARAVAEDLGNDKFTAIACDVTNSAQVTEMARKITVQGDAVRTLVNNAGATWAGALHDMTPESWNREIALNLDAAFVCFHAFQESLKQTRGSVVNIASVNGLSVFGNPAYSAAKAGLIHFTRSIAVEFGKFGIRANAVAPGTVRTPAWESKVRGNPRVFEETMNWYPLNRVIDPSDVANAVAFLSSDQAAAITGVCLPVDSGLMAGQAQLAGAFSQSQYY
ncbi:hypothetical protein VTO42DRAFT_3616 [Malbranchea cinnamomea]